MKYIAKMREVSPGVWQREWPDGRIDVLASSCLREHLISKGLLVTSEERLARVLRAPTLRIDDVGIRDSARHIAAYKQAPHLMAFTKPLTFWEQLYP